MPEMTAKRMGQLKRAIFQVLSQHPDGIQAREVVSKVERVCPPSAFENADYPNRPGVRRYNKILRFTTIGPVKVGWMTKEKGIWKITDEGMKILNRFTDPEDLQRESNRLYREWESNQPSEVEVDEDESRVKASFEEASEAAWTEIREYLTQLNPYDFQNLVAALLKAMGYFVSWVAPAGQDGGVDIIAHVDPLGTKPPRIKIQVKRYTSNKVDVDGMRSFLAALGNQDVGIYVALSGFTSAAENLVRSQENRMVTLIDFERLMDLWIEHNEKLEEASRKLLPLKPIYYLSPEE